MDRPVLLADNFFDVGQYPLHVVSADEEPVGFEAALVGDGRRYGADYATATTANDPWWIRSACDRIRSFNMWGLDRGHNLAGKTVKPQISDIGDAVDANWTDLIPGGVIIPSVTGTGSLDDTYGVLTQEGAWLWRHAARSANYVRLYVPALGVGLKPKVVGLWCGLSYSPTHLYRPSNPDQDFFMVEEAVTPTGARGRGRPGRYRQGTIRLKMADYHEYELARYHVQFLFGGGRPTWLVHDEDQADRAVLAERPGNGVLGLAREAGSNWSYPQGDVEWVEREPALAAA
jgi:hypothetical protein